MGSAKKSYLKVLARSTRIANPIRWSAGEISAAQGSSLDARVTLTVRQRTLNVWMACAWSNHQRSVTPILTVPPRTQSATMVYALEWCRLVNLKRIVLGRPEKPPKGCVKGCWRKSIDNLIFFANPHTYLSYLLKTNN
jgi:hypothetical protein